MTGPSRPSGSHTAPGLVVMGCASEDAESLQEAVDALRRDGLEVEPCEGLDVDPKRLSEVIDRHEGRGLYVLCRSPRLGRERVEELREILLARHVPFARTLTVAVGGRGALADRIRAGLRRASARSSGPSRAVGTSSAAEDEEPTFVGKHDGSVSEELELVPSQPLPLPPRAPAPSPAPAPAEDSVVEAVEAELIAEESSASWSVPTLSPIDLSDLDAGSSVPPRPPSADTTVVGKMPALITGNTVVGPAPTPAVISGDTLPGEKLPRALREAAERALPQPHGARGPGSPDGDPTTPFSRIGSPVAGPSLPPMPGSLAAGSSGPAAAPVPSAALTKSPSGSASDATSPPSPFAPPSPASASEPAPSSPLPASASGPAPSPPPAPPPAAWASASAAAASVSHDGVEPGERGKLLPWVLGGVALSLLVLVIALAITSDTGPEEVASADEAAADDAPTTTPTPSAATPTDREGAEGNEPAADAPSVAPGGVYPVVAAIEARKVRALDVLLVATTWGKPSDYSTAAAYCDGLDVEGIRGWRLPHIGELHSLSQANMLNRGMFWSSTASDTFGDGHMAWNGRRAHALPYATNALAVCVRGEASGS